jgi:septal ring factor EnvC (AmiA/AmiB activator)
MTVIEIIQLVISSGSLWFIVRCSFALGKISQRFDSIEKDIVEIKKDCSIIKNDIRVIDSRMSRLEGQEDVSRSVMMELVKSKGEHKK